MDRLQEWAVLPLLPRLHTQLRATLRLWWALSPLLEYYGNQMPKEARAHNSSDQARQIPKRDLERRKLQERWHAQLSQVQKHWLGDVAHGRTDDDCDGNKPEICAHNGSVIPSYVPSQAHQFNFVEAKHRHRRHKIRDHPTKLNERWKYYCCPR